MHAIPQRPILKRSSEAHKEKYSAASLALSTQAQNNSEEDVWDDISIASWPFLKKRCNIGEEWSCAEDGTEAAAFGLMRESHFR